MHTTLRFEEPTAADIPELARLRIEFLASLLGEPEPEKRAALQESLEAYFAAELGRSYLSWIARDGAAIVGMGGMSLQQQPGGFFDISGRQGYIQNVYTLPSHRRRGISSAIIGRLIASGRERGVQSFELHATPDGEPMYRKLGFYLHPEPTYRLRITAPLTTER